MGLDLAVQCFCMRKHKISAHKWSSMYIFYFIYTRIYILHITNKTCFHRVAGKTGKLENNFSHTYTLSHTASHNLWRTQKFTFIISEASKHGFVSKCLISGSVYYFIFNASGLCFLYTHCYTIYSLQLHSIYILYTLNLYVLSV